MKKCCAALLLCLPLGAMAYPIDVEKDLTGVKVDYTAYDTAYDIGSISLNNYGQVPAACKVIFPQRPRGATGAPGQRARRQERGCHRQVQPADHQAAHRA
ncbi:hypothetical protein OKW51_002635 [Pseudomonas hunanensis]|nr:hypothetical protein [Pseudomonas hunanensis]